MTTIKAKRWTFSLLTSRALLLGVACSALAAPSFAADEKLAPTAPVNINEAPPPWAAMPAAGEEPAVPVETSPPVPVANEAVSANTSVENWYRNRRRSTEKAAPADEQSGLEAAAERGDATAQYRLAMLLRSGNNSGTDIDQSLNWQQRAAQGGNAEAQYGLGLLYANGQYVAADNNQARNWFQQAADQGHVAAKLALLSVSNDAPAEAIATSTQLRDEPAPEPVNMAASPAAPSAPVEAQQLAALQLEESPPPAAAPIPEPVAPPILTPKGPEIVDPASRPEPVMTNASLPAPPNAGSGVSTSMDLTGIEPAVLKQSAEAGDKQAQLMLGTLFEDGAAGLPADLREAAYWYEQAARQDYPKAQYNLGLLYEDGRGVKQDFKQAAYWYDKAAKAGFTEAQNNLGVLFVLGKGVKKDAKRAEQLFTESANKGNADAQRNLGMLRNS